MLRKSKSVPSCECVMMSVWKLSHEECEKAFRCEMLEELELSWCKLRQIPREIGKMKKLKKLTLYGLNDLKSIPEEIGELSNLKDLQIVWCGIESLPKRLKDLKMLKSIILRDLYRLQLNGRPFTQSFWEMIKSTTDLRVLEMNWNEHKQEMVVAALEENGSIVDGGKGPDPYGHFFKRNKENHERAMECVVHMLAIRRWRNALNGVPKEMVKMIAMMLWNTKCDVKAWAKK